MWSEGGDDDGVEQRIVPDEVRVALAARGHDADAGPSSHLLWVPSVCEHPERCAVVDDERVDRGAWWNLATLEPVPLAIDDDGEPWYGLEHSCWFPPDRSACTCGEWWCWNCSGPVDPAPVPQRCEHCESPLAFEAGASRDALAAMTPPALRARRAAGVDRLRVIAARRAELDAEEAAIEAELVDLALVARGVDDCASMRERDEAERLAQREIAADVGVATSRATATCVGRMSTSWHLVHDYPRTHEALAAAELSASHVRVVLNVGGVIDDAQLRARYDAAAPGVCAGLTPGVARDRLRRLVAELQGDDAERRHEQAKRERRACVDHDADGMSWFSLYTSTVVAEGIMQRLTAYAKPLAAESGEGRSFEAIRADVAADLLLTARPSLRAAGASLRATGDIASEAGTRAPHASTPTAPDGPGSMPMPTTETDVDSDERFAIQLSGSTAAPASASATPLGSGGSSLGSGGSSLGPGDASLGPGDASLIPDGAIAAEVMLTVPALSLLGVDASPALIDGRTPIALADAARLAARAPSWTRVLTHPVTGVVLATDAYRPSVAMRRYLVARDQSCRFPGCRRSATVSDIDHLVAWSEGGGTHLANLHHLCPSHHRVKHAPGWGVRRGDDGDTVWTTPSGVEVSTTPPRVGPTFHAAGRPHGQNDALTDEHRHGPTGDRDTSPGPGATDHAGLGLGLGPGGDRDTSPAPGPGPAHGPGPGPVPGATDHLGHDPGPAPVPGATDHAGPGVIGSAGPDETTATDPPPPAP